MRHSGRPSDGGPVEFLVSYKMRRLQCLPARACCDVMPADGVFGFVDDGWLRLAAGTRHERPLGLRDSEGFTRVAIRLLPVRI
jgi:hypothetical protein